jgi:hypothetical protein
MHCLVADKLVAWLVRQKIVSCGSRAAIKSHYESLDAIDVQFEECGRQIVALMNMLVNVEQTIGHNAADHNAACTKVQKLRADLVQCSRQFIWQSIIVSVQPPAVIVKCRVVRILKSGNLHFCALTCFSNALLYVFRATVTDQQDFHVEQNYGSLEARHLESGIVQNRWCALT